MKKSVFAAGIILSMFLFCQVHASNAGPEKSKQANVYIVSPKTGDKVKSPVTVIFGLDGMGVAPAGVEKANTGHHHLLVDVATLPALDKPIPADANHVHFGGGQTQVSLELPAGEHSLQLLLGNHLHIPHQPAIVSDKVLITVE